MATENQYAQHVQSQLRDPPDSIFAYHDTTIGRDLKRNFVELIDKSSLAPDEAGMALLALATAAGLDALAHYGRERLAAVQVPLDQIQEAAESAALMAMLNTYYTFRRVIPDTEYGSPRLRMSVLGSPKIGKGRLDMLAFALSVLNSCESCMRGHERALIELGVSREKLHDLARLASVVAGLSALIRA